MINVTKTFLPPFDEYTAILKRAWDKGWITNNGSLLLELENKLKEYLRVNHLLFCSNGTIVLQMAIKALDITKEIITTPFSYVATTNAILWEGCTPVFVDIEKNNLCIDTYKIEDAITENTEAILATHVYGFPCSIEKIRKIADKYNLKVIYDGAHSFGGIYKNKSLLSYGDISTCSFHATKLFHTVEGGCVISHDEKIAKKLFLYRSFGHIEDEHISIGINAKNSELHAAMGLTVLPRISDIIERRKMLSNLYLNMLRNHIQIPDFKLDDFQYNYSYFPVIFNSEKTLLKVKKILLENEINARRYFYPSLNLVPQIHNTMRCPVSEDISLRVLCLPLYYELEESDIKRICKIILDVLCQG